MNLFSTLYATITLAPTNAFTSIGGITIQRLVSFAINGIIILAGLIFFFMLIIGGLKWVLSGGDKAQTEAARGQITAALVGLVIIFSAWALVTLIGSFFAVNILSLDLPAV